MANERPSCNLRKRPCNFASCVHRETTYLITLDEHKRREDRVRVRIKIRVRVRVRVRVWFRVRVRV
jgi:hypothetical protein